MNDAERVTVLARQLHTTYCAWVATRPLWLPGHHDVDLGKARRFLAALREQGWDLTPTVTDRGCGLCARDVFHDCCVAAAPVVEGAS